MVDFDRFALPIDGDSPCGPDCEYDNEFLALSQAVAGKPEQQFGDTVIPAVEPDWRQVDSLCQALLERTKDLRVVAWLTLANTHLHGAGAFAAGLKLALLLCQQFWEDVHPRLVIDGDADPYLRMSAIAAFSGSEAWGEDRLIQALRASPLVRQPLTVSFRDIELGFAKATDAPYSQAQIESLLADALAAGNTEIPAVADAYVSFQSLCTLLDERVSAADAPEMDRLTNILKPVVQGISRLSAPGAAAVADGADGELEGHAVTARPSAPGISGAVQSREDARRALERVCEYLEKNEPSNPASLFARRAQRMLNMPFLEIMQELSPDSMSQLRMLTGTNTDQ